LNDVTLKDGELVGRGVESESRNPKVVFGKISY